MKSSSGPSKPVERFLDQFGDEQLLLQPQGHRLDERRQPERRGGEIGLEDALELEERLVVEGGEIEVRRRDAASLQAVPDRPFSGNSASCLTREKRSSDAAAITSPSTTRQAAASW